MFGVAMVEEGVELRNAGIRLPILVQCSTAGTELDAALENDLTLTITSYQQAVQASGKASEAGITASVHADIDTGMGRIGFSTGTAADEIAGVAGLANVELDGIYTHFAKSEIEDDPFTLHQVELFGKLVHELSARGVRPPRVHAANSGAIINYPQAYLDMVRAGLMLYGVYPHRTLASKVDLQPALAFQASIVFLKDISTGTSLGYGRAFVAPRPMRVATANVGYADGYPWRLSNKASALIRGKRVPVLGRVSMDQVLFDVSSIPDARLGDRITLMGSDGSERITAEDLAELADTISYEILCGISKRVPREYVGETQAGIA
jgi:alanine racemase